MITLDKYSKPIMTPDGVGLILDGPPSYISCDCTIEAPVRLMGGFFSVSSIGAFSYISRGAVLKGVKSIGRFCSIATNLSIGYGNHNTSFLSTHPLFENIDTKWNENFHTLTKNNLNWLKEMGDKSKSYMRNKNMSPSIGNDVWIGTGVFISRNVHIGDGAVIGAHSVVTKDVEPYSIVAGVPAKIIRKRFDENTIDSLCRIKWWNYGPEILANLDLSNPKDAIKHIEDRIDNGFKVFTPYTLKLNGGSDNSIKIISNK